MSHGRTHGLRTPETTCFRTKSLCTALTQTCADAQSDFQQPQPWRVQLKEPVPGDTPKIKTAHKAISNIAALVVVVVVVWWCGGGGGRVGGGVGEGGGRGWWWWYK